MTPGNSAGELTRLLQAWSGGDSSTLQPFIAIVYNELRSLARKQLAREHGRNQMNPSDLIHEAFIRLLGHPPDAWSGRSQFFGFSARIMRQILIDIARAQATEKRGQGATHVHLSRVGELSGKSQPVDLLDLNTALDELSLLNPRRAEVVELRFFGELEISEVASFLNVSEATVIREWRIARAWLFARLHQHEIRPPTSPIGSGELKRSSER